MPRPLPTVHASATDLLCFSHVRWHWLRQRPHQLLERAARTRRVVMIEEPVFVPGDAEMYVERPLDRLVVARPCLPYALTGSAVARQLRTLLDGWLAGQDVRPAILWYSSPAPLAYSAHLRAPVTVYDRSDDDCAPSAESPAMLRHLEAELLRRADLVFTGAAARHAGRRLAHPRIHAIPDGVEPSVVGLADDPRTQVLAVGAVPRPIRSWDAVWDDVEQHVAAVVRTARARGASPRVVDAPPSPGDGPGQQGAEHLQGPRVAPRTEGGRRGKEAGLERGAQAQPVAEPSLERGTRHRERGTDPADHEGATIDVLADLDLGPAQDGLQRP